MNRKGFVLPVILLSVFVLLVIGAIAWVHFYYLPSTTVQNSTLLQPSTTTKSASSTTLANTTVNASTVASTPTSAVEPLSYTASDTLFTVTEQPVPVSNIFHSTDLEDNCAGQPQSYFDGLSQKYSAGDTAMQYTFHYIGSTWDPIDYAVTVLPNKLGYKTLADFKNDFDLCAAGDEFYPSAVNDRYLLFVPSYNQGDGDNASGLPDGRYLVGSFVEPTLKLN